MKISHHIILASFLLVLSLSTACAKRVPVFTPQAPDVIFDQAVSIIEKNCIDVSGHGVTPDISKRPEIGSLLAQFDPSAELISWKKIVQSQNPFAAGIGIQTGSEKGKVRIREIIEDSPAHRAGLQRGDRIIKIDGEPVKGITMFWANLKGAPGSDVVVTIMDSRDETKEFKITRSVEDWEPAVAEQLIEKNIGYLRIEDINDQTAVEVKSAVKSLMREGMRGLVIDLRDNVSIPSHNIVDTVQLFLNRDAAIAHLDGRTPQLSQTFTAEGWTHYTEIPLVVLINDATASGAEMFAAALHDHKRALLIGEKTAGDGEVRKGFQLKDGSILVIRTHYFQTVAGKPIEGNGILPDMAIELSPREKEAVFRQIHSHATWKRDASSPDRQLTAAVAALRERIARVAQGAK